MSLVGAPPFYFPFLLFAESLSAIAQVIYREFILEMIGSARVNDVCGYEADEIKVCECGCVWALLFQL